MKLYKSLIKKYSKKIQLFIIFILLFIFLYIIFRNIREGFSMGDITGGSSSSSSASQYQYLSPPDPSNATTNINSLTIDQQNAFISKYNTVNDLSANQAGLAPMDQNQLQQLASTVTAPAF